MDLAGGGGGYLYVCVWLELNKQVITENGSPGAGGENHLRSGAISLIVLRVAESGAVVGEPPPGR